MSKLKAFALLGLILPFILGVNAPYAQKPGLISTEITALTADSLTIHGWLTFTPDRPLAPLIVCLPMMQHDHSSYDAFVQAIVEKALLDKQPVPYVLTVDLRGHGKSTRQSSRTLTVTDMPVGEYQKYPADVVTLIHAVVKDTAYRVDSADIRIVGASIGANSAPLVAGDIAGVTSIVLLSPGTDYRGLTPADAVRAFSGRILLVASEKDEYSFVAIGDLSKIAPSAQMLSYSGERHGTDIINDIPSAMSSVVNWIMKR